MRQYSQWDSLTCEEKATCIGEARSFHCCEQYAWNVKGDLQADWNSRVQPQINTLIYTNYKQVFGKRGVQAVLSFHLYLLSSSKDPETARPTIYILTADKKAASRARKLILKHDIFKQLNTGFDVLFEGKSIFMRGEERQETSAPPPETVPVRNDEQARKKATTACLTCRYQSVDLTGPVTNIIQEYLVECDLIRPACNRCTSTGRECLGYGDESSVAQSSILVEPSPSNPGDDTGPLHGPHWSTKQKSLCGAPIKVTPDLSSKNRTWRHATIFCTVQIDDALFAVIPAHVFFPDRTQAGNSTETVESSPSLPNSDSESSDVSNEQSSGDCGSQYDVQSINSIQDALAHQVTSDTLRNHAVYLDMDVDPLSGSKSQPSAFLGFLDPDNASLANLAGPVCNRALDYCLLELEDCEYNEVNYIYTPTKRMLIAESCHRGPLRGKAVLAQGSSGSKVVGISNTATSLLFPWSSKPCTVWQLDSALEPGDSGSPVFGTDDTIIGMAVATVPDHQVSYVLRAADILEDIWSSWSTVIPRIRDTHDGVFANSLLNITQTSLAAHRISAYEDERVGGPFGTNYWLDSGARLQPSTKPQAGPTIPQQISKTAQRRSEVKGRIRAIQAVKENATSWQGELEVECLARGFGAPIYNIVSDRRGGRVAFSIAITIDSQSIAARYWYDSQHLDNAREDAAEVACHQLEATDPLGSQDVSRTRMSAWDQGYGLS